MADGRAPWAPWVPWVRGWVRAIHRDAGYLVVGLTFVYALSGLAVNHLQDWDPNFTNTHHEVALTGTLPAADEAQAAMVLRQLGITVQPDEISRVDAHRLDVVMGRRTVHIDADRRVAVDEGQRPRTLLRAANWLHLNRGKKAWTVIADGYAVLLLYLACSGVVMLPGRRGFLGRGAVLVTLGAAVPVAYVLLSGGPGRH